jgi:hypothetical protein
MAPASLAPAFPCAINKHTPPTSGNTQEAQRMATNNTVNRIELIGYLGAMPEMRFIAK